MKEYFTIDDNGKANLVNTFVHTSDCCIHFFDKIIILQYDTEENKTQLMEQIVMEYSGEIEAVSQGNKTILFKLRIEGE